MRIESRSPCSNERLCHTIPPILDRLFRNRGIENPQQVNFGTQSLLHFNSLLNADLAAEMLASHMLKQSKIMIIGDFDADGATSTALCKSALSMCHYQNVDYLVPNRFDFGYGLSPEIVELAARKNASLIVTVDSGIACLEGVNKAKSLGLDVIITDHHLPGKTLPNADVIVNPNQPNCLFESKSIAGVGVIFYVMLALRQHLTSIGWFESHAIPVPNFGELLDLVALGTVADVVALDRNNRILVHQGLQRIRSRKTRPGISAIIAVADRKNEHMCSTDLGFVIGPRLNAAGRLDDMSLGIETLLADDIQLAHQLAFRLDELNQMRKQIERDMHQQAVDSLDKLALDETDLPAGIVVFKEDFHQGVIGIVAGRLKEKYARPSVVFAIDNEQIIKGSARSIQGVHIRDVLDQVNTQYPNIVTKFGGHAMAAGLSIKKSKFAEFKGAFEHCVAKQMARLPKDSSILTDGELHQSDMTLEIARLLKIQVPWGQHFEEPIFDGTFKLLTQRIVGDKHLKMVVKNGAIEFDAIAFNVDTSQWPDDRADSVRLAYRLDVNHFRGQQSVQLLVEYIEVVSQHKIEPGQRQ